jgi:hypothetical protein
MHIVNDPVDWNPNSDEFGPVMRMMPIGMPCIRFTPLFCLLGACESNMCFTLFVLMFFHSLELGEYDMGEYTE